MCLKTDTILLQYSFFYHFQYFIIACLCTVEIYLEMFKLNSFHGNDFPVKLHTHMLFSTSKKGEVYFTIISNLAVTTRVSVNNVRADLFLEGIFITQQRTQLTR